MNSFGIMGSGGGAAPPLARIVSADRLGCVHSGLTETSPKTIPGTQGSYSATP